MPIFKVYAYRITEGKELDIEADSYDAACNETLIKLLDAGIVLDPMPEPTCVAIKVPIEEVISGCPFPLDTEPVPATEVCLNRKE